MAENKGNDNGSTHPGEIQLTRIPYGANSTPSSLVNELTAPLLAA
jgi:hypothetical protein